MAIHGGLPHPPPLDQSLVIVKIPDIVIVYHDTASLKLTLQYHDQYSVKHSQYE